MNEAVRKQGINTKNQVVDLNYLAFWSGRQDFGRLSFERVK